MHHDPDELRARRRHDALIRGRRRRAVAVGGLAFVTVVAVVAIVLLGRGDDNPARPPAPDPLAGLSTDQLAGQRLIAGFDGTRIPPGLKRLVASGRLAGVILFADNITNRRDTAAMIGELQAVERPAGLDASLAVMVDQEGGSVRRLPGPPRAGAVEMGERGTAFAAGQGRATAASLLSYGVNVDLAPVLDVGRPGSSIAAEGRSFGTSPATVIGAGVDGFAAGLRDGGVAATAKHFPGLGRASVSTDLESQRIAAPRTDIESIDMAPFAAFADAGGEMIMLSLATYPALSNRPAALARGIATGELRDLLGFEGVSITDSLDATAARNFGDRGQVATTAAAAGTDLLLYGDWRTARDIGRTLSSRLEAGALDRAGFEASVGRVLALRQGLNPYPRIAKLQKRTLRGAFLQSR